MKKILNALFLTLLAVITFSGCSDVPAPYDIKEGGDDSELVGDGSKNNPYDVTSYLIKKSGTEIWVEGYIVGCMNNKYDGVDANGEPVFAGNEFVTSNFNVNTNIVIAATTSETSTAKIIAVKLPAGDLREKLNVKDNNANLGMSVKIKGNYASKYCGVTGLIDITAAVLHTSTGDVEIGDGGDTPEPEGNVLFKEAFTTDQGSFTIKDVLLPDGSTYVWKWEKYEDKTPYMVASAQINNVSKASESWLISPSVDLTTSTKATLTFDHAHKFAGEKKSEFFTLWITEAGKEAWQQLTIPTYSDEANWNFVASGNIDLKNFVGKKIQFAFKYLSIDGTSGKWEVNNVKVVGDGQGGGETPEPPVEGTEIFTEALKNNGALANKVKIADFTGWDNAELSFTATTGVDVRNIAYKTEENNTEQTNKINNIWFPSKADNELLISGIKAAGYSKLQLTYEVAANVFDAGATIDLNVLDVAFNDTKLTVPSKVVTAENKDANVFYKMVVEINVPGTDNSTLKFAATAATNTAGLRLYNMKLVGVEKGGEEPEPVNPVYTSSITLPEGTATDANKAAGGKIEIGGEQYDILKLGTGSVVGSWISPTLNAGANKLAFYAVGWTGKKGELTVTIENGGSFTGGTTSQVIVLDGVTEGIKGNPPFLGVTPAKTDYHEFTLEGITSSSTIKFITEAKTDPRAVIFGININ